MPKSDDIHAELYRRQNTTENELREVLGRVDTIAKQNDQLIALLKRALSFMFWIIIFLIAAIVYGAIGKEGLYAVRPGHLSWSADIIAPPDNRHLFSS